MYELYWIAEWIKAIGKGYIPVVFSLPPSNILDTAPGSYEFPIQKAFSSFSVSLSRYYLPIGYIEYHSFIHSFIPGCSRFMIVADVVAVASTFGRASVARRISGTNIRLSRRRELTSDTIFLENLTRKLLTL
ncbi:hypothetical protein Y032_0049g1780 [Ancylostoma ceylanicum]|uniref:Uncharacterized protein n=1 Tax=Ancylostoma ceylanicum TaxID=53326 RepID=A0A016UB09_9BILA|nr:hypothetical protein Y032_0049g1780 [Ancylostoma ceylanicum]